MKKKRANAIIAGCLAVAAAIIAVTWIFAPIIVYGWFGLMAVGMIFGGYMGRHYIRAEVRRVYEEWRLKNLKGQ